MSSYKQPMTITIQDIGLAVIWKLVRPEYDLIRKYGISYSLPNIRSIENIAKENFKKIINHKPSWDDYAVLYREIERGYRFLAFTLADNANHRVAFECGYRLNRARTHYLLMKWLSSPFSLRKLFRWIGNGFFGVATGYMDKPIRMLLMAVAVWCIYATVFFYSPYFLVSSAHHYEPIKSDLSSCLYFSAVTITTLGYGDLAPNQEKPIYRFIAASEALVGYIILGFAVAMLLRRMTIHPYSRIAEIIGKYEDEGKLAENSLKKLEEKA